MSWIVLKNCMVRFFKITISLVSDLHSLNNEVDQASGIEKNENADLISSLPSSRKNPVLCSLKSTLLWERHGNIYIQNSSQVEPIRRCSPLTL